MVEDDGDPGALAQVVLLGVHGGDGAELKLVPGVVAGGAAVAAAAGREVGAVPGEVEPTGVCAVFVAVVIRGLGGVGGVHAVGGAAVVGGRFGG